MELQVPTHWVQFSDKDSNGDKLRSNLDALEEIKYEVHLRTVAYQQRASKYYNHKIWERKLKVGDLALWKLEATGKRAAMGKLVPTCEGPFQITKVVKPIVYRIKELQGNPKPYARIFNTLKGIFNRLRLM